MFEKIRNPNRAKNKSIFAYIIFFFICLVFVFLGVPIDSISGIGGFAAMVNREGIPVVELSRRVDQLQRSANREKGLKDAKSQRDQTREDTRLAINQLVNEAVMFQKAQDSDLDVSDAEIRNEITSIEAFKENGIFKTSLYLNYLQGQRLSAGQFENQIKRIILNSKVDQAFNHAMFVSDLENQMNREIDRVQIGLKYIRISLSGGFNSEDQQREIQKWQELVQDETALNKELRSQKLEWIDSRTVSLRSWETVLPVAVDTQRLFNEVVQVIPEPQVIPQLFPLSEGVVLVALKSFKFSEIENQTDSLLSMNTFLAFGLSRLLFSEWLEDVRNQSKVQINPRIF